MEFKDYYHILGIFNDASNEQIKSAYKEESKKWHPDKNVGTDTTFQMQEINEAYLILKDEEARKRYDEERTRYYEFLNKKNNENEFSEEFQIKDEILKKWMNNAKNQSIKIVKEFGKLSVEAGKSATTEILKYLFFTSIVGLVMFFIIKGCEKNTFSDNSEIKFDSIDTISKYVPQNEITIDTSSVSNYSENNYTDTTSVSYNIPENEIYYCIALFKMKSKYPFSQLVDNELIYSYVYSTKISQIFEMNDTISDNKYRKLDNLENEMMRYESQDVVISREILFFKNYTDASIKRQDLKNEN